MIALAVAEGVRILAYERAVVFTNKSCSREISLQKGETLTNSDTSDGRCKLPNADITVKKGRLGLLAEDPLCQLSSPPYSSRSSSCHGRRRRGRPIGHCNQRRRYKVQKVGKKGKKTTTPGVEPGISRGGESQPKSSALAIRPRGR